MLTHGRVLGISFQEKPLWLRLFPACRGLTGMSHQRSAQAGRSMANESDLDPSDEEGEIEGQGQSKAPKHPQDMQKWVQCARCNCWRKVDLSPPFCRPLHVA